MDGIYKIKKAKFPNFNNADICILYNSLENKNDNNNEDKKILSSDNDCDFYSIKDVENCKSKNYVGNNRKNNDDNNAEKSEEISIDDNSDNGLNEFEYALIEIKLNINKVEDSLIK